jgi:dolichol-phosphate mannosyltransferase
MHDLITIVAPCHNEEECIDEFHRRLTEVIGKLDVSVEIILIDDGSTDKTWLGIKRIAQKDPRVRGLKLTRNFGHQMALWAGYEAARGGAVITMDADLQHPPETIPQLIGIWKQGYDVVNSVRRYTRREGIFKRFSSTAFYRVFSYLSGMPYRSGIADFRLLDHKVVHALRSMPERINSLRFAIQWMGFSQAYIEYECQQRFAGSSKYTPAKMLLFAMQSIVQFSVFPLRLSFIVSVVCAGLFILYGMYALYAKFVTGDTVPGWTSVILTMSFLAAMQFFIMGLLGEYVGIIYEEVKRRPRYLVNEMVEFSATPERASRDQSDRIAAGK